MKKLLIILFSLISYFGYSQSLPYISGDTFGIIFKDGSNYHKIYALNGTYYVNYNGTNLYTLESDGDITFIGDISYALVHGHAAFSDSAREIGTVSQSQYYQVTNAGNSLFTVDEEADVNLRNDSIIIEKVGDYVVFYGFTLSGASTNDYRIRLSKNGNTVIPTFTGTATGASNFLNLSNCIYLDGLIVGDKLSIDVANISANNNNPTFRDGFIYIRKEHD